MYERDAPWHRGLSGLLPTLEVTSPSVQLFNSEVSQKKKANRNTLAPKPLSLSLSLSLSIYIYGFPRLAMGYSSDFLYIE